MRTLSYGAAILEAFTQLMETDERVFLLGQGLWSPWYVGSSMTDLDVRFGRDRVLDTPICENATTGAAIGAAITGSRPIVVHPRMDFALLAIDPIVNQAANWSYLFEAQVPVPVVFRTIINRGGEQGAQHSQALQALFQHIPGLKVVMPGTATDAKGLLLAAVQDPNPVVYIDDRWCYAEEGPVDVGMEFQPIGQAAIRREGRDVTVVCWSWMVGQALAAAELLDEEGISVEVVDMRSVKPWDLATPLASIEKTGHCIVAEAAWLTGSCASDLVAQLARQAWGALRQPIRQVGIADCPAATSSAFEQVYYPRSETVALACRGLLSGTLDDRIASEDYPGTIR